MEHFIFAWSNWDAPKGVQPVGDNVMVECIIYNEGQEPVHTRKMISAGKLDWGFSGGVVSYRYQIMETVD